MRLKQQQAKKILETVNRVYTIGLNPNNEEPVISEISHGLALQLLIEADDVINCGDVVGGFSFVRVYSGGNFDLMMVGNNVDDILVEIEDKETIPWQWEKFLSEDHYIPLHKYS